MQEFGPGKHTLGQGNEVFCNLVTDAGSCYELFQHAAQLGIQLQDGIYPIRPAEGVAMSLVLPFEADNALVAEAKPAEDTYLAGQQFGATAIAWTRAAGLAPEEKRPGAAGV